jgi:hypothetical protein
MSFCAGPLRCLQVSTGRPVTPLWLLPGGAFGYQSVHWANRSVADLDDREIFPVAGKISRSFGLRHTRPHNPVAPSTSGTDSAGARVHNADS